MRLMTKYECGYSLWPERASGRKRLLSSGRAIYFGVALVVLVIAVHSVADMVARNPTDIAVVEAPVVPEAAAGAGTCRRDWPDFENGCAVRPAPTVAASAASPVRVIADDRAAPGIRANQVETTRPATATTTTVDGSGRLPSAGRAPRARAVPPPAVAVNSSEPQLTFKRGYAVRHAARTVAALPAQSTMQPAAAPEQVKPASTKSKPRQERTAVQVYESADGRRIVVHRQYGSARVDARSDIGRFGSAQIGSDRFGRRIGERQGLIYPSGPRGLY
jgi:hypothetical protein